MKSWQNKPFQNKKGSQVQRQPRFQSGMTFQQKFQSITQNVLSHMTASKTLKGCAMHPKLSKKCRKCLQIQKDHTVKMTKIQEAPLQRQFPDVFKWKSGLFRSNFNQKLQKNIEDSTKYRFLRQIHTVKQLSNSLTSEQISIDAYITGTTDNPTDFICYLYRLGQLHPSKEQIIIMLRSNNVNIRCLILLYLRVHIQPIQVYAALNHSFKDKKLLSTITIGQYAIRLLNQEELNHGGFRLPRIPIKIQKQIEKNITQLQQQSKKQFKRQRSRSRQRKQHIVQDNQVLFKKQSSQSSSSSSSSSSSESSDQQQKPLFQNPQNLQPLLLPATKHQPEVKLNLKQRIRLLQEKNRAQLQRKALVQAYKKENISNLQSDQEQFNENDQIQKYNIG